MGVYQLAGVSTSLLAVFGESVMRRSILPLGLLSVCVLAFCCCSGPQDKPVKQQPVAPAVTPTAANNAKLALANPEEATIRANVDAFVKSYNEHDAKTIAAMFAEDAT